MRRAIRETGARLFYLPKYSPDLNPIEQFFAKLKHWLRNTIKPILDATADVRKLLRKRRIYPNVNSSRSRIKAHRQT